MNTLRLTAHAQKRMQQRCISELQVQLIDTFGRTFEQKGGTQCAFIPRDTIAALRRALETIEGMRLVSSDAGQAITVFHESRRRRRA